MLDPEEPRRLQLEHFRLSMLIAKSVLLGVQGRSVWRWRVDEVSQSGVAGFLQPSYSPRELILLVRHVCLPSEKLDAY